ncbi:heavy metal-associated isoprenylated plant protein 3-like [Euphorbia lathyris]|uniref:heavy metal-associated isoprenylated plant protein 3-like n=1 Tax=Euphorbia lathyris TaxID=212925 RepID=UPI0033132BB1
MWKHFKGAAMVMEDLQDYLMIKAMYAKSKLAFRKCSRLCDIDIPMEFETQPDQEQREGGGDKKGAASVAGGEKKDEKSVSVYKIDMHCEGCCKKIRRAVKHLEGVESAKTDRQSNKLTVTGKVDPEKVKARLEKKMKKEVEIVSPQPNKDAGAAAATADGGEKKDEPKPVSVYKVDMHCEGSCKKIRRAVKHLEGVESAKTNRQSNKLTVTGEVDPEKVKARLEKKMKKEVQIVSPQPKKEAGGGGEKKADEKAAEKKPEVKKPPPEEMQIMVVLKIRTHCDDCITKMKKIIRKIKGVESVAVDDRKDLVTVKGTMEVKDLVPYLSEKFRTLVEVRRQTRQRKKSAAATETEEEARKRPMLRK